MLFSCSIPFLPACLSIEWWFYYLPSIMLSMLEESGFYSGIFDEWKISQRMKIKNKETRAHTIHFRTFWMTTEKGFDLNLTFFFVVLLFAAGDNIFRSDILSTSIEKKVSFFPSFNVLMYTKRHKKQQKKVVVTWLMAMLSFVSNCFQYTLNARYFSIAKLFR